MPPLLDTLVEIAFGLLFFLLFTLLPVLAVCSTTLVFRSFRSLRTFGLLVSAVLLLHLASYAGLRISGILHAAWLEVDRNTDGDLTLELVEMSFAGYGFMETPFAPLYTPLPEGG